MSQLALFTIEEARALTERIRRSVESLWADLLESYEREAWRVMGYTSWRDYAVAEFGWSQPHCYRLLDQGRVIRAIEQAAGISPIGEIVKESEARELKAHLDLLTDNVREAVEEAAPEHQAEAALAAVIQTKNEVREIRKVDLGGGVSHPARFPEAVLTELALLVEPGWRVLDPFAGAGGIHDLQARGVETVGVEIEREWADLHPDTIYGNALHLPFEDAWFDAVVTSPTYGNRLSDHHEAYDPQARRSYRHDLGRALHEDNSGAMQWGPRYRSFHEAAWREALRVLRPSGRFIVNIKDHIRGGERQAVSAWHVRTLIGMGCQFLDCVPVVSPGFRASANGKARVEAELVWVLTKGDG